MSQREKEIYVKILNAIIKKMKELLGEKIALTCARRAPLVINLKGKVIDYYGEGEVVVDILLKQYEDVMLDNCYRLIKEAIKPIIKKARVKLPERIALKLILY